MTRYAYQQSAYGYPWETRNEEDDMAKLSGVQQPFWLKMLAERHHRIVDTETDQVVWYVRSDIAPEPGTKKGSLG